MVRTRCITECQIPKSCQDSHVPRSTYNIPNPPSHKDSTIYSTRALLSAPVIEYSRWQVEPHECSSADGAEDWPLDEKAPGCTRVSEMKASSSRHEKKKIENRHGSLILAWVGSVRRMSRKHRRIEGGRGYVNHDGDSEKGLGGGGGQDCQEAFVWSILTDTARFVLYGHELKSLRSKQAGKYRSSVPQAYSVHFSDREHSRMLAGSGLTHGTKCAKPEKNIHIYTYIYTWYIQVLRII